MGLTVHFEVLNQLGTPMMHSATLANRPAAGITGRIFFRTDSPYGIFRDTGSAWDQISGASTFSGSLATGQVAFGSATDTIAGTNNLFWDNANGRLGIGTNTPTTQFTVNGPGNGTGQMQLKTANRPNALVFNWFDTPNIGEIWYYGETRFRQNATGLNLVLSSAGNVIIGTNTDTGDRFQVTGNVRIQGGLTTSFDINASGNFVRGGYVVTAIVGRESSWYVSFTNGNNGGVQIVQPNFPTQAPTGNVNGLSISYRFGGATSTFINNSILIDNTINQTSGTGITRGIYINPTLTAAANWRSIEWSNNTGFGLYGAGTAANYLGGSLGIKTTAIYAPSTFSLDVNGGLLIKNTAGTTAQLTLINADPSLGGNNGFLVNTVGGTSGSSYVDLQGYYGTSITGSTALRLNPAGGPVIVNSTTNSGEQVQITGSLRVNGQLSPTMGTPSGQHLIINCDGTLYKINLFNP
jgi:hypothetical protein